MNYIRVFDDIFKQFNGPKFAVKFWDGKINYYGSGQTTIFTLLIKDSLTAKRLLAQGSLGFGEAYMEGSLQIEGDIEAYLRLRHQLKLVKKSLRLAIASFLATRQIPRNRTEQIAYHYDLGNNFFKLLLDQETMSYSAGKYNNKLETLATAQQNKLNLVCQWLNLPPKAEILDLGSGWGGFAFQATKSYDWNVTGLSLSKAQLKYCEHLIKQNHSQKQIKIINADMISTHPTTEFDGVVMIESIEHVGKKLLPSFLENVKKHLKPGRPLFIQTTGRYHPKNFDRWTQKYVFPGGYLPSKNELINAANYAGLTIEQFEDDTEDYINTMSAWIKNLKAHRGEIEKEFGQPLYRLWELWMHGAKVNFEIGSMSLFRILLRKPLK